MNNFFIFGCGRSGTSVLQKLLNANSKIAIPPETGLYSLVLNNLPKGLQFPIVSKDEISEVIDYVFTSERIKYLPISKDNIKKTLSRDQPLTKATLISEILEEFRIAKNKDIWGEKTPRHVVFIDEIGRDFPNAKFIFIVRDPRAVAASFKSVKASFGSKNVIVPIRQWLQATLAVKRFMSAAQMKSNRVLIIRYEDLTADGQKMLASIQKFIGVPVEDIQNKKTETVFYENQRGHMNNTEKKLFEDSVNKWKSELSHFEILAIEYKLGNLMSNYSYDRIGHKSYILGMIFYCIFLISWPLERLLRKMAK